MAFVVHYDARLKPRDIGFTARSLAQQNFRASPFVAWCAVLLQRAVARVE